MNNTNPEQTMPAAGYSYVFTVFTPTYNRSSTLGRVFQSLNAQTFREFEWLIVDDGSTDNTHELIETWQKEAWFPIRYVFQANQGKHVAFNRGVHEARGEFFLPLDSDDACVPEALAKFKYYWDAIPEHERSQFSAVTALCMNQHHQIIGDKFPWDVTDSDSLEMVYRFKITGEKWGFHRTDVLKKHLFPEISGERFVPESLVWNAIARTYRTRFVNEPLRVYFLSQDRQSDRLTHARLSDPSKYAAGHVLFHQSVLVRNIDWFLYAPEKFLRSAILYIRYSFHLRIDLLTQLNKTNNWTSKVLVLIMLPLGCLFYLKDKRLLRSRNTNSIGASR